jgi:AP endonuclease-2
MKSSRTGLPKPVALPPSYDAFFSFPIRKSGYSGVATYTRTSIVPRKAEEGLSGIVQPKPPLAEEERVSGVDAYPQRVIGDEDENKDEEEVMQLDYKDLDSEGRAVVVDLGLFVLINVYCPNDGNGTEERNKYKADFHRVLEARVRGLVERERREVVVVGDLNACAAVLDHCEGPLMVARGQAEGMEGEDGFWGKNVRRWLRDWMVNEDDTGGCMVDIVRRLWPDRKGMYTCAFTWYILDKRCDLRSVQVGIPRYLLAIPTMVHASIIFSLRGVFCPGSRVLISSLRSKEVITAQSILTCTTRSLMPMVI